MSDDIARGRLVRGKQLGEAYIVDAGTPVKKGTITQRLMGLFFPRNAQGKPTRPKATGDDIQITGNMLWDWYQGKVRTPRDRRKLYNLYDDLDEVPEIFAVLDAVAEDATQIDRERQKTVWVESSNARVVEIGEKLFARIELENIVFGLARDTAKYGDDFAELVIANDPDDKDKQIIDGLQWRDPRDVERIETKDGYLVGFLPQRNDFTGVKSENAFIKLKDQMIEPWEMIHWRIRKRKLPKINPNSMYGAWSSIVYAARRPGMQLKLLEDMLSIYRLTRTMNHYVFYVDTGTASSPDDAQAILKDWKRAFKRKVFTSPADKVMASANDPMTMLEDIFWPVRAGSESRVDVIEGQPNVSDIEDINHFVNKLFGSMGAPKGFFGYEGDVEFRTILSMQDVRFSRKVRPVQRTIIIGLGRMLEIELILQGLDPDKETFTIRMVPPSVLEDLNRLDAVQQFVDLADRMYELGVNMGLNKDEWRRHVLGTVLGLSDHDIERFTTPPPGGEEPPEGEEGPSGRFKGRESDAGRIEEVVDNVMSSYVRDTLMNRGETGYTSIAKGVASHGDRQPREESEVREIDVDFNDEDFFRRIVPNGEGRETDVVDDDDGNEDSDE